MKKVFKKVRIALALALIVVMSLSMTVFAEGEANEAAQAAKDAIFQVEVVYKDPATGSSFVLQTGTGFLIGAEATSGEYMITCDHVARLSDKDLAWYKDYFGVDQGSQLDTSIQIIVKGSVSVGATVVNESSAGDMDFAILKLDQPISERKTLPLKTDGVDETSDCYALGFPGLVTYMEDATVYTAEDVTVTKGSVSNNITNNGYNYIQHSATLATGNSGGPLLDSNGNVIGINTGGQWEDANTYYYSLDIREVTEVLDYLNIVYTDSSGSRIGGGSSEQTTEATTENPQMSEVAVKLKSAVSNSEELKAADYTEESFSAFEGALSTAQTVANNDAATEEEMQEALDALTEAKNALEEIQTVDKTALAAEIATAEGLTEADYDADSYSEMTLALEAAKTVNDKADATQEQVDTALSDLKNKEAALKQKSNTMMYIIIGIIAAVVIIIIVIIIVLVSKSKKKSQPSMNVPPMGGMNGGMGAPSIPSAQPRPQLSYPQTPAPEPPRRAPQAANAYPAPPTIPQVAEGAGETVLLNEGSGETTLLSETNQIMAVLVKTKSGEKITIGKREFKIGKERSKVDYCITNNSVSRIHAIITFENGEYYIRDNNSTNYTYINGEAVAASQKIKLSNGDRIKFSDEEFQFKLA